MAKKKILLIDDNYHSSQKGAFLNCYEYRFLIDAGFEVYSLSFPTELPKDSTENDRFFIMPRSRIRQKKIKFIGDRRVSGFVSSVVEEIQPDLIHCHLVSFCPAAVYDGIDGKIPVIQSLHGTNLFCSTSWGCLPDSGPCELGIGFKCFLKGCLPMSHTFLYMNLKRCYWENMIQKVNVFHCPSRQIMNSAIRLGIHHVEHVELCINDVFFDGKRERPQGAPTVMFAGTLAQCKGVDILIDAIQIVRRSVPDVKLLIAGKGIMEKELVKKVNHQGIGDHVIFLGRISQDVLLNYYKKSDVFVIPSVWQEQFGLVGPEAMACGLPCVGSDIGGIPEWLRHGEWGRLVPPGNVDHLANAIKFYLTCRKEAFSQGLKGQQYARQAFNQDRYRMDMLRLIERVIDEGQ